MIWNIDETDLMQGEMILLLVITVYLNNIFKMIITTKDNYIT